MTWKFDIHDKCAKNIFDIIVGLERILVIEWCTITRGFPYNLVCTNVLFVYMHVYSDGAQQFDVVVSSWQDI